MIRLLVSNNSELLRHLGSSPFRRMNIEVVVACTGEEVVEAAERDHPRLALIDGGLPGKSGYAAARAIKHQNPSCRVVLVVGKFLGAEKMRQVVESGCDEVLVAPMTADQLYDTMALQLGLPRRGADRFRIDLAVVTDDGDRAVDGRVVDLSVDGARLILPEPMGEGTKLKLSITPDESEEAEPIRLTAHVVWSQSREDTTVAGTAFDDVDDQTRSQLSRLRHWDVTRTEDGVRVVVKGDLTEVTDFEDLDTTLVGSVEFDLEQVSYINPIGASEWARFVKLIPVLRYRYISCSIPFILQAGLSGEMLGRGTVVSFYAPYRCRACDFSEERLLYTESVREAGNKAPTYVCQSCDGHLELDEDGERYLAFLAGDEE